MTRKEYYAQYYLKNREKLKASASEWAKNNPGRRSEIIKDWVEKNKERRDEIRKKSAEKHRNERNKRQSERKKQNLHKGAADRAKRRAAERLRTPLWSNTDEIVKVYETCAKITKETGIPHEVDHFYPILGRAVSGLHVVENLRIIPASENRKKSNLLPCEN